MAISDISVSEESAPIPGIILLSHGPLCEAIIESGKMIVGDLEGVEAFPLNPGCDLEAYSDQVVNAYKAMPEGSIILFDMFAGSPFNQIVRRAGEIHLHAICGLSLPMLIEANMQRELVSGEELIRVLQEAAQDSIVNVDEFIRTLDEA